MSIIEYYSLKKRQRTDYKIIILCDIIYLSEVFVILRVKGWTSVKSADSIDLHSSKIEYGVTGYTCTDKGTTNQSPGGGGGRVVEFFVDKLSAG